MTQNHSDEDEEITKLAESFGLPCNVRISQELSERLKPNGFLTDFGIQYSDRIKSVLGILKALITPKTKGEETLPKAQVIPLLVARGPYIREELVSIKAELTDDDGKKVISLTAILEED